MFELGSQVGTDESGRAGQENAFTRGRTGRICTMLLGVDRSSSRLTSARILVYLVRQGQGRMPDPALTTGSAAG